MARKIAVEIVGDSASLERAFARSSRSAERFNSNVGKAGRHTSIFSGLGKVAGVAAGAAGIGGLADAVKASFDEMESSQKVAAQTTAVIKSTGDASNVSAKQVDDLATSLMNKSGTDDEVVKSGENMLLTFTNIRNEAGRGNDVFNRATNTMLDMSTALGESTTSAAMQLGKALNDPIKGVTALRRVGVQFTDGQRAQIKQMVRTGNTMGAQKIILHELNREFGGSAKAAGQTLPGKLNILKQNMLNLGGTIAAKLAPQITHVVTQITHWISRSRNQHTILNIVRGAVGALSTAVRILGGAFRFLSRLVGGNANAIKFLVGVYATWKLASLASRIIGVATSFGILTSAEAGATAATEGLSIALGPAVLVAGALAAGAALGTLIYQIPIVKQLADQAADSIAHLFGYTNPMAQYAGKQAPTQNMAALIRGQAAQLERRGMSPAAAARTLEGRYPSVAARDIETYAGVRGTPAAAAGMHVTFNGVTDTNEIQKRINETIARANRRTPHSRR